MPRSKRWGFVFTDIHYNNTNALCRTIAHEVAHGEFRLSHPFQDFPSIPKRSTQNLMDYADGQQLRKYQWDDIHNLRSVKIWGQKEDGNAYEAGEIAQKIFQELRCSYLSGDTEFKSKYLDRLPIRDQVFLAGERIDICLEYDENKKILLNEEIISTTGEYDKSSRFDCTKLKRVPGIFTEKNKFGGLTIYTNTNHFKAYLKPTETSVQDDFNKVWTSINVDDGINDNELKKLKSIAACASKYFTPQQRYKILTKLAPVNKNIVETREDLILDLFETSVHRDDLNEFVDLIKTDINLFRILFTQIDDIKFDYWNDENNKTRFLNTLYSIWSLSDESKIASYTYNQDNPLVYYYNAGGTFQRTFSIENEEFRFSGTDICARKYIDDEGYTQDKCYNIFQPIRVMYDEGETIKLPSEDIPAFYLMGVHDLENLKARMKSLNFTVDAISLVAAGGGLAGLKNLPKAYRLARIIISGVEIGTTAVDMVLSYSSICDENSEFCTKLKAYNFWLQMATLSSDIVVSKMANKAAREALQVADDVVPNDIRKHLESVAGKAVNNHSIDDLLAKLKTQKQKDAFIADFSTFDAVTRKKFFEKPELVESWKVIKSVDDPVLAARSTDIVELELVSRYLDDINVAGGYSNWKAFDNLFSSSRQRAIEKFGKEAEDLIYVKYHDNGGAAAEILDHYGTDGVNALKKASTIDGAASELVKNKTVYRAVNEATYNFDKLKNQGVIDASPVEHPAYVSLDNYTDANTIQQKLQLPKKPTWVAEFDGNQIVNDIRVPNGKFLTAEYKEVLCRSYPEINGVKLEGGGSQFITNSEIKINKLINLETGEAITFSH